MLSRMLVDFASIRDYSDVTVYADIDPLSI